MGHSPPFQKIHQNPFITFEIFCTQKRTQRIRERGKWGEKEDTERDRYEDRTSLAEVIIRTLFCPYQNCSVRVQAISSPHWKSRLPARKAVARTEYIQWHVCTGDTETEGGLDWQGHRWQLLVTTYRTRLIRSFSVSVLGRVVRRGYLPHRDGEITRRNCESTWWPRSKTTTSDTRGWYTHSDSKYTGLQGGPKKVSPKLLFISSPHINRFLKFFHCYPQQEICNKEAITELITPKKCQYTTLQTIRLQKLHRLKQIAMRDSTA